MSVIILGGNECMERQYKDLCKEYNKGKNTMVEHSRTASIAALRSILEKHTLQQGA